MGNTLKPSQTQKIPEVHITLPEESQDSTYTLVLTDPDAPSRTDKKWSEYAHFIASGIKGSGPSFAVDFDKANTLIPYVGPGPPVGTGKHRYVFLLYKENSPPKVFEGDRPTWGTGIPSSGVRDWAKKNGLSLLTINFFFAEEK